MGYIKKYKFEKLLLLPVKLRFKKKRTIAEVDLHSENCHFIVFYAGAIGDCVLASYFVAQLKKAFPNSKLTFICIPAAAKLLECFNEIDFVFKYGIFSIRTISAFFSLRAWKSMFKEYLAIHRHVKKEQGYKVLISLTRIDSLLGIYKTKLISASIPNDYSIGLNSNNGRGIYFDVPVYDPGNLVEHLTKTWGGILSKLTKADTKIDPMVKCTVKDAVLDHKKFNLTKKYCVIHTGGGSDATQTKWISKRWAADNFYELANWLVQQYDYKIVFVGTADEKAPSFDTLKNDHFIDLYGKTTLPQLFPLFLNASLYIGNDSGLAHIASFVGVRAFVIWGYPSYIDYATISKNTQLVRLDLPCEPCLHIFDDRPCKNTNWEFKCIKDISVSSVKLKIAAAVGT